MSVDSSRPVVVIGGAIGMGRAAMDNFLERLPGRPITYTAYESQAAAPRTRSRRRRAGTTTW